MPTSRSDGRPSHRIAKLLARAGVASRREIERMIEERRVAIGGVPVETPATLLESLDGVTVDGKPVAPPEAARLFLFHKPAGLLTTERDPAGRPTIYDRLPKTLPRLMPVGRLDLATEGLLLMTTDGGLKRQLELPATGVERAYRARAYGHVTQPQLEELIEGVEIDGIRYGSIDANIERRTGANVWIEMILTEGKNREVRRVLEHLGLQVSRLIRTRYGPFVLGDLAPGEIGEVRQHDVEAFRADPRRRELPQPSRRGVARLDRGPQPGSEDRAARVAPPRDRPGPRQGAAAGDARRVRPLREPEGVRSVRAGRPVRERPEGRERPERPVRGDAAPRRPRGEAEARPRRFDARAGNPATAAGVFVPDRERSERPARGERPSRKPPREDARRADRAPDPAGGPVRGKPNAGAKPTREKEGARRRADGSIAVRRGGARAERARSHRAQQGDGPAPTPPKRPRGR